MIRPIKQNNVNFTGTAKVPELYQNVTGAKLQSVSKDEFSATPVQTQTEPVIETPIEAEPKAKKRPLHSAKLGLMNFLKGFNNVTDTASGVVRGVVEGVIGATVVGVFAKNLKESKGSFFGTIGGVLKDTGHEAAKVIKAVPKVIAEWAPLTTARKVVEEPFELAKNLKGNKAGIAAAAVTGLGILAFRTIQGKIVANKKNANLDHSLNEGHVPTK